MENNEILSDKKRGRPAKGVSNRVSVRLTPAQDSILCRIGHDFRVYAKASQDMNKSAVLQLILDKAAYLKERFFDEGKNGILYDNIISQLLQSCEDFYSIADACNDDAQREYYVDRGENMARIASILEDINYNDLKPDVTQKGFGFGRHKKTGRFMGYGDQRKIDKNYNKKLFNEAINKSIQRRIRREEKQNAE